MIKFILATVLVPLVAFAGLPPTTIKGQSEAGKTTTFDLAVPFNQATRTSGVGALIETGNNNILKNPGFEHTTYSTSWTASGGTSAVGTTTNIGAGAKSYTWNSSSASQTLTSDAITVPELFKGQNCEAGIWIKVPSGTATHTLSVTDGTNTLNSVTVTSSSAFVYNPVTFICPTSGTIALRLTSVAADEPLIALDNGYMGLLKSQQISQAELYGAIKYSGTASCAWTTGNTGGAYTDFAADTDCPTPTLYGKAEAPSTKVPRIKFSNLPPGRYQVVMTGEFTAETTGTTASFRFRAYDGTSYSAVRSFIVNSGTNNGPDASPLVAFFEYSTTQSSIEFRPRGVSSSDSNDPFISNDSTSRDFEIQVYRFPTQSDLAMRSNLPVLPTVQRFTSGSGTYTRPNGVSYIKVRMVGAGGGGAGSSTTANNGGSGGAGGNTTFGTSLLTANGGNGGGGSGAGAGGSGGSATVNSPAITIIALSGAGGQGSPLLSSGGYGSGGNGGVSPLGGAGAGGQAAGNSQVTAQPNTGSGGGGGGGVSSGTAGSGGGAGGYIEAIIHNPSATYSYSVGTAGTAGTAGTSGHNGGSGGSGFIEVTEYYQNTNAPYLVGGVVYNTTVYSGGVNGVNSVATGTYTPTITNETNVAASTSFVWNYSRVADMVTMSGPIGIDPTSAGATTTWELSLPVTSDFTSTEDLTATCSGDISAQETAYCYAETTNNRAQCSMYSGTLSDHAVRCVIQYRVRQ